MNKLLHIYLCLFFLILSACIGKQSRSPFSSLGRAQNVMIVNSVSIKSNQLIINGSNLSVVTDVKIKNSTMTVNESFVIESKSDNKIIANGLNNISLFTNAVLDLVLSNASASSSFTINFSLCDSLLNGHGLDCTLSPNDKDVLAYDALSGKWKPRSVNGLAYIGAWDASAGTTPSAQPAGSYYIIGIAGNIGGAFTVNAGDWIVSNGAAWQKVDNSNTIISVFGRTGNVTALEGDYNLDKMADVDLQTVAPITNDFLKYNGTHWVPFSLALSNGTVTTVTATAPLIVTNPTTTPNISIPQANGTTNGYLSSADWTLFKNKEGSITAATTAEYLRGDKVWATLDTAAVPENGFFYFTLPRVRSTTIGTPFTLTSVAIDQNDTVQAAFPKLQAQINTLSAGKLNLTGGTLSIGTITGVPTPTNANDVSNKAYVDSQIAGANYWTLSGSDIYRTIGKIGVGTATPASKLDVNGAVKIGVDATACSSTIAGAMRFNTPNIEFCNGTVWTAFSVAGSGVSSVNSLTGIVSLTTTNIPEGTNLYFTNARTLSSTITAPTLTNAAIAVGDTVQTMAGKLQAQINARETAITPGTVAQYLRGDKSLSTFATDVINSTLSSFAVGANVTVASTDSILVAFGKTQSQINAHTTALAGKLNLTGGTLSVGTINGVPNPTNTDDVANKGYVDGFGQWTKAGTDVYRASGNVGIGTAAPADLLQISSGAAKYGIIVGSTVGVPAVASGAYIRSEGRIYVGDGTAALPAFAFGLAGQEDNGMFRPLNDNIGFSTAGSERVRIDSVGNVGIGSIPPQAKLDVSGDILVNGLTVGRGRFNDIGSVAFGAQALNAVNNGTRNTAIGYRTLFNDLTGGSNIAIGHSSLLNNTAGTSNLAIGVNSLLNNDTGNYNISIGEETLASNSSGIRNVALGYQALQTNVGKDESTAIGFQAMQIANNTASSGPTRNTAIGTFSLQGGPSAALNTGTGNTAVGHSSLLIVTNGSENTSIGANSGSGLSTGTRNVFLGFNSGKSVTTGTKNVIIGSNDGLGIATQSNNIILSDGDGTMRMQIDSGGSAFFGSHIKPTLDNNSDLGDSGHKFKQLFAQNGTINVSDRRMKKEIKSSNLGLNFINSLKPVSYIWKNDIDTSVHYGFIAQEVEAILNKMLNPDLSSSTSIVDHDFKNDKYGLRYTEFISPMVKSIQELFGMFKSLVARVTGIESELRTYQNSVNKLEVENKMLKDYICEKDPKARLCHQ